MIKSFLLSIALSSPALAETYRMYSLEQKKHLEIEFIQEDKFLLSKNCRKKETLNCQAWQATKKKVPKLIRKDVGSIGHPAAQYCHAHNAENRILKGPKNTEDDFCLFKDGSLISAWSLYYAHYR